MGQIGSTEKYLVAGANSGRQYSPDEVVRLHPLQLFLDANFPVTVFLVNQRSAILLFWRDDHSGGDAVAGLELQ